MSQSELLNEEEIKGYINDSFNLKLDREVFLKPTRDIVIDLYAKFLDDIYCKWRRPRNLNDDEEPNVKALMVKWIRFITAPYGNMYTFQMGDLVMPNRKRTTSFFNMLIFVRAQIESSWADWQEMVDEWASNRQAIDRINKELEDRRIELEEAALLRAQSESVENLRKAIQDERHLFESAKRRCEEREIEAQKVKENIKSLSEDIQIKKLEVETIKRDMDDAKRALQLFTDASALEERLATLNYNLSNKEQDCGIEENKLGLELEKRKALTKDRNQQFEHEIGQILSKIEFLKAKRAEIRDKQQHESERNRICIEKATRQLESLAARCKKTEPLVKIGIEALNNFKAKLDCLF